MNFPFANNPDNRETIPTAKNKSGFLATQEPHEYANQALFRSVTDHIWGTQTQVTNGDATFYTDTSGNPLDSADAAVTISEDDKILIGHDETLTVAHLLDCGGKKVRIEMLQGINWNLSTFSLNLGVTAGDSFSGDLELTGTGTLTILDSNGLRVHHTAMTISNTAGDIIINNDPFSTTIPVVATASGSVGTEILPSRGDHSHLATFSSTTPVSETSAGTVGSETTPSRGDHSHIALPMIIWRMVNSESTGNQTPLGGGGTDWEVANELENEAPLGGNSSVTESSGTFSFATTGYWSIRFIGDFSTSGVAFETTMSALIISTDDNSTYSSLVSNSSSTPTAKAGSVTCEILIVVNSISLDKIRISQSSVSSINFVGSSILNRTYIIFEKKSGL